jgi:hypothetical protein
VSFLRWLLPSSPAIITDEAWARRELAKHNGVFTYRAGLAGQCWNPDQSGFNPIIGPAEVRYTALADGGVTAIITRPPGRSPKRLAAPGLETPVKGRDGLPALHNPSCLVPDQAHPR